MADLRGEAWSFNHAWAEALNQRVGTLYQLQRHGQICRLLEIQND